MGRGEGHRLSISLRRAVVLGPAGLKMNTPDWWLSGRKGTLSRKSQLEVQAFLKVSKTMKLDLEDGWIAEQVEKVGGGHPSKQAIQQLRTQIAEDKKWSPPNPPVDSFTEEVSSGRRHVESE